MIMIITRYLLVLTTIVTLAVMPVQASDDYKTSEEYLALRDSMRNAFNDADSVRFYPALHKLEGYLLQQGDYHAYYTQRCNEIVFQLNRRHIYEAYKLAKQLSVELTDKKLDSEMYMAINMMGHIYNYSGNKEMAKQCFREVIERMEREGYRESEVAIYMNLVEVYLKEDPKEAQRLVAKALEIAKETAPDRVFDIEAQRTMNYYTMGDMKRFMEGYRAYRKGLSEGLSAISGRSLDIYYLASQGRTAEAVNLALQNENDRYETVADIYAKAGLWEQAFRALQQSAIESDSINSVILSSSMQGIQEELQVYEAERRAERIWFSGLIAVLFLLILLVFALVYIIVIRRSHMRDMEKAYNRILESERMKSSFIQNVSHEIRTPLNIISGFAQIMADPSYQMEAEERRTIADTVVHNTHIITTMIDEVIEISTLESIAKQEFDALYFNEELTKIVNDFAAEVMMHDHVLTFETEIEDEFIVMGKAQYLKRVIVPLLDNAAKVIPTEGGTIKVHAALEGTHVVITVTDNGPGVPVSEAEHIFERFVKLSAFKEGLGLGLTFSRNMARHMCGDVWLDTTYEGPGARFKVRL